MKTQKSMIIIGAAGAGKTRRANEEAKKRSDNYGTTFWEEIQRPFGLGWALGSCPDTLIVEGMPPKALKKAATREFLKRLVDGDDIMIEEKHKNPRTVPAPMFIFTVLTPPKLDLSLASGMRFEVVEV